MNDWWRAWKRLLVSEKVMGIHDLPVPWRCQKHTIVPRSDESYLVPQKFTLSHATTSNPIQSRGKKFEVQVQRSFGSLLRRSKQVVVSDCEIKKHCLPM